MAPHTQWADCWVHNVQDSVNVRLQFLHRVPLPSSRFTRLPYPRTKESQRETVLLDTQTCGQAEHRRGLWALSGRRNSVSLGFRLIPGSDSALSEMGRFGHRPVFHEKSRSTPTAACRPLSHFFAAHDLYTWRPQKHSTRGKTTTLLRLG